MSPRPLALVALVALVASLGLPAAALAKKGKSLRSSGGPADALEAPKHLGFEVVSFVRSIDRHGRPISRTTVAGDPDAIYKRLKDLFATDKTFTKGWTIAGLGHSSKGHSVAATLRSPSKQEYTMWGKLDPSGRMVFTLEGKAHRDPHPRLSTPVGDRLAR